MKSLLDPKFRYTPSYETDLKGRLPESTGKCATPLWTPPNVPPRWCLSTRRPWRHAVGITLSDGGLLFYGLVTLYAEGVIAHGRKP